MKPAVLLMAVIVSTSSVSCASTDPGDPRGPQLDQASFDAWNAEAVASAAPPPPPPDSTCVIAERAALAAVLRHEQMAHLDTPPPPAEPGIGDRLGMMVAMSGIVVLASMALAVAVAWLQSRLPPGGGGRGYAT